MRRIFCTAAIAASCGLAAVVVGGCGAANVIDPVARAAKVSNAAPGMRMVFSMRLTSAALPGPIVGTGSGAFDPSARTGSLSMAMKFGSIPQISQALGSSMLRIQEIISGSNVYLKLPSLLGRPRPHDAKPWLKINLATAARSAGIPGLSSLLSNPAASDPSQFLRYLRATSGHVTRVGSAPVEGRQTTHYRAVIQLDRVARGFPRADRPQVRQAVAALERIAQLHAMPVNVWVDGRHLVRRIQFGFAETVSGQRLGVAMEIDIPRYGPQKPPALPPASQVTNLTAAASTATGGTPSSS